MALIQDKLEYYEPDEKTDSICTVYKVFLIFYHIYILVLFVYTFYKTSIASYSWLFFTNLYFGVFPLFAFFREGSYVPSVLRFYNWELSIVSIISIFLVFEGIFIYSVTELCLILGYFVLNVVNTFFCWHITQRIYDGRKGVNGVFQTFMTNNMNNQTYNVTNQKKESTKKFIGKGQTIRNSNYVKV